VSPRSSCSARCSDSASSPLRRPWRSSAPSWSSGARRSSLIHTASLAVVAVGALLDRRGLRLLLHGLRRRRSLVGKPSDAYNASLPVQLPLIVSYILTFTCSYGSQRLRLLLVLGLLPADGAHLDDRPRRGRRVAAPGRSRSRHCSVWRPPWAWLGSPAPSTAVPSCTAALGSSGVRRCARAPVIDGAPRPPRASVEVTTTSTAQHAGELAAPLCAGSSIAERPGALHGHRSRKRSSTSSRSPRRDERELHRHAAHHALAAGVAG